MARRLILLATPRSGSRLVNTMLGRHPDVELHDEIFTPHDPPLGPTPRPGDDFSAITKMGRGYYDWFFSRPCEKRYVGFTLHLLNHRENTRWVLGDDAAVKVLVRRRNLLAQYVSWLRGMQTQKWIVSRGEAFTPPPPIRIEPGAFVWYVNRQLSGWNKVIRRCERRRVEHHSVWYESIPNERLRPLLAALGLPPAELNPGYVKQGEGAVRDRISNWDQLSRHLPPSHRGYLELADVADVV
ncbi:MAG TPA: hypothetical protein VGE52_22330 [Pirellulales bacterium]